MHTKVFLTLSVLAGAGFAQERIVFAPAQGSALQKTWTTRHSLEAVDMNRSRGDESGPVQMKTNSIAAEEVLEVVDQYHLVSAERPEKFRRVYSKNRRTSQLFRPGGRKSQKVRQPSMLRGLSVVFTWVEDEGTYGKYYDGEELDERFLAEIRADLDLAFALPAGPVSPGDSWELPAAALVDLFGRSGTVPYERPEVADAFLMRALDSGVAGGMEQAFGGTSEGGARITFQEVRDSEAGRLAVLQLTCDIQCEKDRTDYVQDRTTRREDREGIEYVDAFLRLSVKGQGEILWNLDARHASSLTFGGEEEVYARIEHRAPADPEGVTRGQDVTMRGPLVIEASFAPAE